MARNFGFECEVVGGSSATLAILREQGLTSQNGLHGYHCDCSTCDPFGDDLIHAQHDCTVEGEFITKVLEHGSADADKVISGLSAALRRARATTSSAGGLHVHVDRRDLDLATQARVWRIYLRYQDDLAELAAARFDNVRSYNGPIYLGRDPRQHGIWSVSDDTLFALRSGSQPSSFRDDFTVGSYGCTHGTLTVGGRTDWLWATGYGTYEFRLWNATLAEWRMRLAVGMSVAIVEAAAHGVNVTPRTRRPLEAVVGPYMDEDTWAGVLRQRYSKGGLLT